MEELHLIQTFFVYTFEKPKVHNCPSDLLVNFPYFSIPSALPEWHFHLWKAFSGSKLNRNSINRPRKVLKPTRGYLKNDTEESKFFDFN